MMKAIIQFMLCVMWFAGVVLGIADHPNLQTQIVINLSGWLLFLVAAILLLIFRDDFKGLK